MLAWLRSEFRRINTALEFDPLTAEARAALVDHLLNGPPELPRAPRADTTEDDALVQHLQVGMWHAACARHGAADEPRLRRGVDWLLAAERIWRFAPRFLAFPYLALNGAAGGWPLTFLEHEAERHFIVGNADGVVVYEQAWTLVQRMRALGVTHPSMPSLLRELARVLDRLAAVHAALQAVLDHDAYFHHIRHYYEAVTLDGRTFAGVNAGDQGWSMALDLALGVAQPHREYKAYLRSRLAYLPPSHRGLVEAELADDGWLTALTDAASAMPWGAELARSAVGVYDALVRATWAHMDLAVTFIDRGPGTSGTEMRFLEETIRMRRDHPGIARLRTLAG